MTARPPDRVSLATPQAAAPPKRPCSADFSDGGPSFYVPFAVWVAIQLSALSIAAGGIRVWPGARDPLEHYAVALLLAVQVIATAMLFPWLLGHLRLGICVLASSAAFTALAGVITDDDLRSFAGAWVCMAGWLTAMLILGLSRLSPLSTAAAIGLTTTVAAGVPVVRYLRQEFLHLAPPAPLSGMHLDPVTGALAQLQAGSGDASTWLFLLLAPAVASVIRFACGARVVSTTYPQH